MTEALIVEWTVWLFHECVRTNDPKQAWQLLQARLSNEKYRQELLQKEAEYALPQGVYYIMQKHRPTHTIDIKNERRDKGIHLWQYWQYIGAPLIMFPRKKVEKSKNQLFLFNASKAVYSGFGW